VVVPVLVLGAWASASFGLEKTAVRIDDLERPGDWDAATVCQIAYYNYCTGWLWAWSGWSTYDMVGVCYETCCSDPGLTAELQSTREWIFSALPPGRGFTGTIDIWAADENYCPASVLASQLFSFYSGWNQHAWEMSVPDAFVVTVTCGPAPFALSRFVSDRPAAGPTGPQACGTCYQLHRLTHSYYFGTPGTMLCPGEKLNDGVCDIEWLWDVALLCDSSVGANDWYGETRSWATVKGLYR
jgi:hypothetical protein